MANDYYAAFVEEAFLKPIRSVLIVDDDYPTFDEMLSLEIAQLAGEKPKRDKAWYKNPERIRKVIAAFRTPARPLLVDIHDGANVSVGAEITIAGHLHQSDLLVLDYELDRTKSGDGALAIAILRRLARKEHFNLVVVHTSEPLDSVFRQTLLGMLSPAPTFLSDVEMQQAVAILLAADDANEDRDQPQVIAPSAELSAAIGVDQYLYARQNPSAYLRAMARGQAPFAGFKALGDAHGIALDDLKLILRHQLNGVEATLRSAMEPGMPLVLNWSEAEPKYIAGESVFVAFSSKGDVDDLLVALANALNSWRPEPSHLFLARLRAEMDEHGVMAQAPVLNNRHALAHWYRRLLDADGEKRRWLVSETVSRHSDQLMAGILPEVERFATRLVEAEAAQGTSTDLCKAHYEVDLTKDDQALASAREHNAYVCSKSPEGWHLTTGHVFKVGDDHWVCVSPACDTVPAQISAARLEVYGARLPFMAVKLHAIKDGKKLSDVQTNRYLFVRLDGAVKTFSFNDPSGDASAPAWHILLAARKGQLGPDFSFDLLLPESGKGGMRFRRHKAKIVAQLRYEYALNLIHRLGGTMTRVGLDFA